jgi:hypothetical protein
MAKQRRVVHLFDPTVADVRRAVRQLVARERPTAEAHQLDSETHGGAVDGTVCMCGIVNVPRPGGAQRAGWHDRPMGKVTPPGTAGEHPAPASGLRAACVHEYAHLVVARGFGACGFVTVARIAGRTEGGAAWCGRFQLFGELSDDEWRIVALAGAIAERVEARTACDSRSLLESLQRPGALSDSDARLAFGYDASDIERCLRLVTTCWQEIDAQAAERAASVAKDHDGLLDALP